MGKILVMGSAVADVIIKLEDHLPVKGEDVHVLSQEMRLGGCAYNVYDMVRHFGEDAIPFFPIGSGPYADFVAGAFKERGIISACPRPAEANGCCYCFIEADGERTFIVYHGAEYRFRQEWFNTLDADDIDMCYICGLEIEETTGPVIADFLEAHPHIRVFFAPGPRILKIDHTLLSRLFALHPILHLNEEEAAACAQIIRELGMDREPNMTGTSPDLTDIGESVAEKDDLLAGSTSKIEPDSSRKDEEGPGTGSIGEVTPDIDDQKNDALCSTARAIYSATSQTVIITLGAKGCLSYDGRTLLTLPPYPARQVDTIGAGDAHAGACIAQLHRGTPLKAALDTANRLASAVVATPGALLSEADYANCMTGI